MCIKFEIILWVVILTVVSSYCFAVISSADSQVSRSNPPHEKQAKPMPPPPEPILLEEKIDELDKNTQELLDHVKGYSKSGGDE